MKVGLDVAKRMGVAFLDGDIIYTSAFSGTPQEQLFWLLHTFGITNNSTVYVEKLNHFVNANTTRSLLLRTGYLVYGLEDFCTTSTEYVVATQARKFQGVKTKKEAQALFPGLSADEADAVIVLLYGLQKKHSDFLVKSLED